MKCPTVLLFSCISSLLGTVELSQWQQIYFSLPSVVDIIFPTNWCPLLINSREKAGFVPIFIKNYTCIWVRPHCSALLLFMMAGISLYHVICEVIYCFVSLGFLAYNWMFLSCLCRGVEILRQESSFYCWRLAEQIYFHFRIFYCSRYFQPWFKFQTKTCL